MIWGYVDPCGVDIGHLDTFGDRMAAARLLGCRAVKVSGRWVLRPRCGRGGTVAVQLDHPTFMRLFGGPLEAERVEYVDDRDTFEEVARSMDRAGIEDWLGTGYTAGPLVLAYMDTLHGPAARYGWAVVDSLETGGPAAVRPDTLPAVAAELITADLVELAALEYGAGGRNICAGVYHNAGAYLHTLAGVTARRAAAPLEMPAAVNDRRRAAAAPSHSDRPPARPRPAAPAARPAVSADNGPVVILATSGPLTGAAAGLIVNLCAGGVVQVLEPVAGTEYRGRVDGRGAVAGLAGKVPPAALLAVRVAVLDLLQGLGRAA